MKLRVISLAVLLALLSAVVVAPLAGAHHKPGHAQGISFPIEGEGTITEVTDPALGVTEGDVARLEGTLTVKKFEVQDGTIVAIGTLSGQILDEAGNVISTVEDLAVELPLISLSGQEQNGVCPILELTLGPLDLDLLGLHVHLDTVHLVIEAHPGEGQLLGNLLCAIVGLFDAGAPTNIIKDLLNTLLDLLEWLRE